MKRFSCMDCNCSAKDTETGIWMCMADPNWPAPCEYDDDEEKDDDSSWGKSKEYYY